MPKIGMEPIRRAEIINATLMCICEHGIEGATLDKVASRAGCSKGVAAYYFKNKKELILASFKAFLSYYGKKIGGDITSDMSASEMLAITLNHSLPPEGDNLASVNDINVSDLNGMDAMVISPAQKAKLFLQFFSRAALDVDLQKVVVEAYGADVKGIASIFHYGRTTGEFEAANGAAEDQKSAYGLLAMMVGLSFFRVAGFSLSEEKDNRIICEDYLNQLKKSSSEALK